MRPEIVADMTANLSSADLVFESAEMEDLAEEITTGNYLGNSEDNDKCEKTSSGNQPPHLIVEKVEDPYDDAVETVEFSFLDDCNICCGVCGEIVMYEKLLSDHLPSEHPNIFRLGELSADGTPIEEWLASKLAEEKHAMELSLGHTSEGTLGHGMSGRTSIGKLKTVQRKVSAIRVNPRQMSLQILDIALKAKLEEKLEKTVPVTLVDKEHARCGLCNAVVSLNKKFEIVHLVRHFNAWHPSSHLCTGTWQRRVQETDGLKPLSMQDFAIVEQGLVWGDNLQCIWCGLFVDSESLANHFAEAHADSVEVPKCNLCLKELVLNAKMQDKYGMDFGITLPEEDKFSVAKYQLVFTSEAALVQGISDRITNDSSSSSPIDLDRFEQTLDQSLVSKDVAMTSSGLNCKTTCDDLGPEAYFNSRMSFGRNKKPKRQFIMPALRQAAPIDSDYIEPVNESHWKCRICKSNIYAAVISAGAIRHYRHKHPEHLASMQYELCKARLERISDGAMEFIHPQLIECLLCDNTYNLHKPFNMCRAIRHLKSKHPTLMPEYAGVSAEKLLSENCESLSSSTKITANSQKSTDNNLVKEQVQLQETDRNIDNSIGEEFDFGSDSIIVVLPEGEETTIVDDALASQILSAVNSGYHLVSSSDNTSSTFSGIHTTSDFVSPEVNAMAHLPPPPLEKQQKVKMSEQVGQFSSYYGSEIVNSLPEPLLDNRSPLMPELNIE